MRGYINFAIGLLFVLGGLSGEMVLRGTQNSAALVVVGAGLMAMGAYRVTRAS